MCILLVHHIAYKAKQHALCNARQSLCGKICDVLCLVAGLWRCMTHGRTSGQEACPCPTESLLQAVPCSTARLHCWVVACMAAA